MQLATNSSSVQETEYMYNLTLSIKGTIELKRQSSEIFASGNFFKNSQGAPPVSMTLAANLSPVSTTPAVNFVIDTGGKFATSINDTGVKFATSVIALVANNVSNIRLLTP
jgi:hypothetical protein